MFLTADWPAPLNIKAYTTTRIGGFSASPYDSFNLASHVGDDKKVVEQNRRLLKEKLKLPSEPLWLNQTHSNIVINSNDQLTDADGCYTNEPNKVCVVMTADCLPILICNRQGTEVAAIHGGWRSLASGILENAISKFKVHPNDLLVWLGPAIGPQQFEVGSEVRGQFLQLNQETEHAFSPSALTPDPSSINSVFGSPLPLAGEGLGVRVGREKPRWLADIYQITKILLNSLNITQIYGGNFCTYSDRERFYSYRRTQKTGRMATLIWIAK